MSQFVPNEGGPDSQSNRPKDPLTSHKRRTNHKSTREIGKRRVMQTWDQRPWFKALVRVLLAAIAAGLVHLKMQ
jgi:hypothetical protein